MAALKEGAPSIACEVVAQTVPALQQWAEERDDSMCRDLQDLLVKMQAILSARLAQRNGDTYFQAISKRDSVIAELNQLRESLAQSKVAYSKAIAERDAALADRNQAIIERDAAISEHNKARVEVTQLRDALAKACDERDQLRHDIGAMKQRQFTSYTCTSSSQPEAAADAAVGAAAPGVSTGGTWSMGMGAGSSPFPDGVFDALLSSAKRYFGGTGSDTQSSQGTRQLDVTQRWRNFYQETLSLISSVTQMYEAFSSRISPLLMGLQRLIQEYYREAIYRRLNGAPPPPDDAEQAQLVGSVCKSELVTKDTLLNHLMDFCLSREAELPDDILARTDFRDWAKAACELLVLLLIDPRPCQLRDFPHGSRFVPEQAQLLEGSKKKSVVATLIPALFDSSGILLHTGLVKCEPDCATRALATTTN